MRSPLVLLLLSISLAAGCAHAPSPLAPDRDPSNPDAPEATPAPRPTAFALEAGAQTAAEHRHPMPATVVSQGYSCPMHPDVHADAPGECPKCGMALVAGSSRKEAR